MRITRLLLICGASVFSCCDSEKSNAPFSYYCSTVSYSKNVMPIIDSHCAIYGCHISGFARGNFNSYDELYSKIEDGTFQLRVFDLKIMPPNDSLSDDELMTLQCWVDNGALEN